MVTNDNVQINTGTLTHVIDVPSTFGNAHVIELNGEMTMARHEGLVDA